MMLTRFNDKKYDDEKSTICIDGGDQPDEIVRQINMVLEPQGLRFVDVTREDDAWVAYCLEKIAK